MAIKNPRRRRRFQLALVTGYYRSHDRVPIRATWIAVIWKLPGWKVWRGSREGAFSLN